MKAVVNEIEKKETDFPKLMKADSGDVVFFDTLESGVLVSSIRMGEDIGYYSTCWDMSEFQDFHGTVTLSND